MYDNYHYPMGADTPDAPWNQIDPEPVTRECEVTVVMSKKMDIDTIDYYIDDEDGYPRIEPMHNWTEDYRNQYNGIQGLLGKLIEYIDKDLQRDNLASDQRQELKFLRDEAAGWDIDDLDINES